MYSHFIFFGLVFHNEKTLTVRKSTNSKILHFLDRAQFDILLYCIRMNVLYETNRYFIHVI